MGGGGTTATAQPPVAAAAKQQVGGDPRAEALRCPRCDSANTKFCYYNNYSLAQPRHFCKACKRYWTRGGTLRNVPVGGGCRKNKRSRGGANSHSNHNGNKHSSTSSSVTSVTANTSSLPQAVTGTLPSLTSAALSLPGSSLASLLLSGGAGDHLCLFQAMQSVVPDAGAFELQQQPTSQVDHLLGLGYGCAASQMPVKPWQQQLQDGGGGVLDGFYAPLLSSSIVPGLEELQMCGKEVKMEASAGGDHHQQKTAAAGDQQWELLPSSSPCVDATTSVTSDALVAAASMNLAVSSAATAPAASSLMYWSGGAATAWPDIANCGSSIATLF